MILHVGVFLYVMERLQVIVVGQLNVFQADRMTQPKYFLIEMKVIIQPRASYVLSF